MANVERSGAADRRLMFERARRTFVCWVFLLATIFVLMATSQWIPLLLFDPLKQALAEHYYITYIVFFCALLTVTVFIFFERVRFMSPLNWILTIFIVECVTWGLARAVVASRIDHFGYSFAAVMLVVIMVIFIGGSVKHDFTLNIALFFIGSIILFFAVVCLVIAHILTGYKYLAYIYIPLAVVMVVVFLIYHTQTILGGRYAEMRISDFLLAALMIFHDFVVLFVVTFYLASHIEKSI